MTISTAGQLKQVLHESLEKIENFEQCILLDYPDYLNLGDHLIWLSSIFYLTDTLKSKIVYTASFKTFSKTEMKQKASDAPIFFCGGGNLGDIWSPSQQFREQIISEYRDRPIIILPQSIYFSDHQKLQQAAKIFNSHSNLTLFTRDQYSYELALKHFYNCQVFLAPDMVFQMAEMPYLSLNIHPKPSILYHCRSDRELNRNHTPISIETHDLVKQDWASYSWILGTDKSWIKEIAAQLLREGWQRGLMTPKEWISRQYWLSNCSQDNVFKDVHNPTVSRRSWSFMHSGLYQFHQHQLIITNRLHGHILSILLGIPHLFLPNSYHKNKAFYETWTKEIPFCTFINDPSQIETDIRTLLNRFPKAA